MCERVERGADVFWVEPGHAIGDLEHVWKQKDDPKSGKTYYVNQSTKAKVWKLEHGKAEKKDKSDKKEKKDKSDKKEKKDKKDKGEKAEDDLDKKDKSDKKEKKDKKDKGEKAEDDLDKKDKSDKKEKKDKKDKGEKKDKSDKKKPVDETVAGDESNEKKTKKDKKRDSAADDDPAKKKDKEEKINKEPSSSSSKVGETSAPTFVDPSATTTTASAAAAFDGDVLTSPPPPPPPPTTVSSVSGATEYVSNHATASPSPSLASEHPRRDDVDNDVKKGGPTIATLSLLDRISAIDDGQTDNRSPVRGTAEEQHHLPPFSAAMPSAQTLEAPPPAMQKTSNTSGASGAAVGVGVRPVKGAAADPLGDTPLPPLRMASPLPAAPSIAEETPVRPRPILKGPDSLPSSRRVSFVKQPVVAPDDTTTTETAVGDGSSGGGWSAPKHSIAEDALTAIPSAYGSIPSASITTTTTNTTSEGGSQLVFHRTESMPDTDQCPPTDQDSLSSYAPRSSSTGPPASASAPTPPPPPPPPPAAPASTAPPSTTLLTEPLVDPVVEEEEEPAAEPVRSAGYHSTGGYMGAEPSAYEQKGPSFHPTTTAPRFDTEEGMRQVDRSAPPVDDEWPEWANAEPVASHDVSPPPPVPTAYHGAKAIDAQQQLSDDLRMFLATEQGAPPSYHPVATDDFDATPNESEYHSRQEPVPSAPPYVSAAAAAAPLDPLVYQNERSPTVDASKARMADAFDDWGSASEPRQPSPSGLPHAPERTFGSNADVAPLDDEETTEPLRVAEAAATTAVPQHSKGHNQLNSHPRLTPEEAGVAEQNMQFGRIAATVATNAPDPASGSPSRRNGVPSALLNLDDEFAAFCAAEAKATVEATPSPRRDPAAATQFFADIHPAQAETLASLEQFHPPAYAPPEAVPKDDMVALRLAELSPRGTAASARVARVAGGIAELAGPTAPAVTLDPANSAALDLQHSVALGGTFAESGVFSASTVVISQDRLRAQLNVDELRYLDGLKEELAKADTRLQQIQNDIRRLDDRRGLLGVDEYARLTRDPAPSADDALDYSVAHNGVPAAFATMLRLTRQQLASSAKETHRTAAVRWAYFVEKLGRDEASVTLIDTMDRL